MTLELLPHVEIYANGSKSSSDVYPFVNGKPSKELATCEMCKLYRDDVDWCDGWVEDKDNAPFFCGPICKKFSPNHEAQELISSLSI